MPLFHAATLATLTALATLASPAAALPLAAAEVTSATVLADAKSAFKYALHNITTEYACGARLAVEDPCCSRADDC